MATIRVNEFPLRVASLPATVAGTQGMPVAIPFTVERLYGFAGDLQARLEPPAGVPGIPAVAANLAAAETSGTIMLPLAADAPPGVHDLAISFTLSFNGQQLVIPGRVQATIAASPAK